MEAFSDWDRGRQQVFLEGANGIAGLLCLTNEGEVAAGPSLLTVPSVGADTKPSLLPVPSVVADTEPSEGADTLLIGSSGADTEPSEGADTLLKDLLEQRLQGHGGHGLQLGHH